MNAQTQSNGNSVMVQGRLVWTLGADMFKGNQKKDQNTKQVVIDQKTGQPVVEYGFGLAVPKIDPRTGQFTAEYVKVYQALQAEALTLFPSGQIPPSFSMKYKDGDTAIDDKGVAYSTREGYANHIVISCTTRIPIKYFIYQGGNNILVNDGIKNGDYVNVQLNIKAHPASGTYKAGLYVNPSAVQLIAAGPEIINTPSGDQMFGMAPPVYAGQAITPTAPVMPGMGQPAMQPPQYAQAPQQPPMAPPAAPQYAQPAQAQPHYDVLPQTFQPPQAPAYGQPPMAPPAAPQYAQPVMPGMMPPR